MLEAANMAVWRRRPAQGLIHHSDHGSQYTAVTFTSRLERAGILGSMGTVGDALDNAMAESFFATLQTELLDRGRWATRQSLAMAVLECIEGSYNRKRRHSALNCVSPEEYEGMMPNSDIGSKRRDMRQLLHSAGLSTRPGQCQAKRKTKERPIV